VKEDKNKHNNPDDLGISPENLLQVIKQEWENELKRLRLKAIQYLPRRKKESPYECLVQSGHAEIEGDSLLFVYGNALEVLNNEAFQNTVEQISFQ
jgi:leucine-rich repeat-containing protein 49